MASAWGFKGEAEALSANANRNSRVGVNPPLPCFLMSSVFVEIYNEDSMSGDEEVDEEEVKICSAEMIWISAVFALFERNL